MEARTIDLHIGAIFDTKAALVHVCRTHAVQNNFKYGTTKSDKTRYRIHCKQAECPWSLYASTLETTQRFCIKKFHSVHTCLISWVPRISKSRKGSFLLYLKGLQQFYCNKDSRESTRVAKVYSARNSARLKTGTRSRHQVPQGMESQRTCDHQHQWKLRGLLCLTT